MTTDQLLLLFFGIPLSILGMGLRRALGGRGILLLFFSGTAAGLYALLLEAFLHRLGHGLPLPGPPAQGLVHGYGLFALGGGLLGALGAVLVRFRGQGVTP